MTKIEQFLEFEIFKVGTYTLTFGKITTVILILFITIFFLWLVRKLIFRQKLKAKIEEGSLYSIFQILRYLIWIISILLMLDTLGLKLNVLLAGSAALLVGVGLGLQNTFNNFISGLTILFEGSIKVGDILEIDGDVVKILNTGLRTTAAINRDDIIFILPNSLITSNKVINWSHQTKKTRFRIKVGVAYGSDVDLVTSLLKEAALEHDDISDKSAINARLINFGNSSLDFELLFFSDNVFRIENVKSDIRKIINRKFKENNISIPFPQLDLHLKSNATKSDIE
ncbi:MAG: mechanosensitive ion channel [Bacteroidales bacterium]|nr:mechanosensitive ion channel [Bacteroidales bacterium]